MEVSTNFQTNFHRSTFISMEANSLPWELPWNSLEVDLHTWKFPWKLVDVDLRPWELAEASMEIHKIFHVGGSGRFHCFYQLHLSRICSVEASDSSTPAVVRCVVGVGGAVWVDKQSDSLFTHGAQAVFT